MRSWGEAVHSAPRIYATHKLFWGSRGVTFRTCGAVSRPRGFLERARIFRAHVKFYSAHPRAHHALIGAWSARFPVFATAPRSGRGPESDSGPRIRAGVTFRPMS